jgi:hypothetical protein
MYEHVCVCVFVRVCMRICYATNPVCVRMCANVCEMVYLSLCACVYVHMYTCMQYCIALCDNVNV